MSFITKRNIVSRGYLSNQPPPKKIRKQENAISALLKRQRSRLVNPFEEKYSKPFWKYLFSWNDDDKKAPDETKDVGDDEEDISFLINEKDEGKPLSSLVKDAQDEDEERKPPIIFKDAKVIGEDEKDDEEFLTALNATMIPVVPISSEQPMNELVKQELEASIRSKFVEDGYKERMKKTKDTQRVLKSKELAEQMEIEKKKSEELNKALKDGKEEETDIQFANLLEKMRKNIPVSEDELKFYVVQRMIRGLRDNLNGRVFSQDSIPEKHYFVPHEYKDDYFAVFDAVKSKTPKIHRIEGKEYKLAYNPKKKVVRLIRVLPDSLQNPDFNRYFSTLRNEFYL